MLHLPPIPPAITDLPRDPRGYPVPAENTWSDPQTPSLAVQDGQRCVVLYANGRCAMCGCPLHSDEPLYRLHTEDHTRHAFGQNGTMHTAGPGHRTCMLFAAAVCPFFATEGSRRRDDDRVHERGRRAALLGYNRVTIAISGGLQFQYFGIVDQLRFKTAADVIPHLETAIATDRRVDTSSRMYWKKNREAERAFRTAYRQQGWVVPGN